MALTILSFSIYIAVVVIIGIISSRKETEEDFMIANRKVSGVQVAATMSAGFFDGATLSIYLAYIYLYGMSATWLFIGLAIGFILLRKYYALIIKRKADEAQAYTMPEYFFKIFGKRNGLMFSFLLVFQYFLLMIVNFIIAGKVLSLIFPLPYYVSVAIGGGVILTYLLLAGFKAVIKTDFFQLMIMFIMSLTVAIFLFGRTTIPMSEFNPIALGFGNLIGFLLLGSIGILVAPDLWQRIFATKDEANLKRGLGYSAIILPLLAIIISIVGLATKQFFPNIAPEDALITGFSRLLPFGLKEFGMVLLYAVALSSSDTITFMISSIFTRDLKNYTKRYSEESMKKLTRFFMLFFVAVTVIVAIFYQNIIALGLSMGSLSLALFPAILGSFYWKLNERAVFWSLFLSFVSVIVIFVADKVNPQNAAISLPVAMIALIVLQKVFNRNNQILRS
ncbi:MAG: sodium:solute symporter family protein [Candidatus Wolfebacteria bacterium]|nr:sodium:solute symporter family protein [Candidatus Wolfebacteria bacterium]